MGRDDGHRRGTTHPGLQLGRAEQPREPAQAQRARKAGQSASWSAEERHASVSSTNTFCHLSHREWSKFPKFPKVSTFSSVTCWWAAGAPTSRERLGELRGRLSALTPGPRRGGQPRGEPGWPQLCRYQLCDLGRGTVSQGLQLLIRKMGNDHGGHGEQRWTVAGRAWAVSLTELPAAPKLQAH